MGQTLPNTHLAYYNANQLGTPSKAVTIPEVYELIRTDEDVKSATASIIKKHSEGIKTNFEGVFKASYQAQKKTTLDAVTYSGNIDRSSGQKPAFYHNGIINLDIDENPKEDLDLFRRLVKNGHFPFVEACARSVSGFINGSLWINARIEIPEELQYKYDQLEDLHKRYHSAISHALFNIVIVHLETKERFRPDQTIIRLSAEELHLLKIETGHQLSIKVGHAKDVKRARYITHDADLITFQAKAVTHSDLEKLEDYLKQKNQVKTMEGKALNITASDHFDFCHQFAVNHGYDYQEGMKQDYLVRFCIGANLLGIPEDETRTHILDNIHPREDSDFLSYPYRYYSDSFGVWKHKVRINQKTFLPLDVEADTFMTFDKYLEDSPDFPKLLDRIAQLQRSVLYVPTGAGKTTATMSAIREDLKKRFPDKTFIYISPLTAITHQVGINHDKLQIICEGHTAHHSAWFEDSICTWKSFIDWSERLYEEGQLKDVVLVMDEVHELITASGYQRLSTLPFIMNNCFKVIGLSATPLMPLFSHFHFTPIKCERINNPAITIDSKRITQDQLYKTIISFGNAHRDDKTLYFYNDKSHIEKLSKAMKRKGMKSDFFHADLKRKQGGTYRQLIESGHLPEGTNHFFSTKVLGFGTSFKGLDHIVYITRSRTKDFLEFKQSIARLREDQINVTLIIIEPKKETPGKYRQYDFDLHRYQDDLVRYHDKAEVWNRFDTSRVVEGIAPLDNNLPSDLNRMIKFNKMTGKYFVDRLQLFNEQYQRIIHAISADDLLQFIKLIPNVRFVDSQQDASITSQDQQIIELVEQEHQDEEQADIEAIKELLTEQTGAVMKYIYQETDDLKLKDRIKGHLRIVKAVDDLEDTEAIDRRFKRTAKAVNRYLSLTNSYGEDIDPEKLSKYCFLDNYRYGRLIRQLSSLNNVRRYDIGEDLQRGSEQDAKGRDKMTVTLAHLELIRFMESVQGQKIGFGDLYEQIKDKDFFQVLNLNRQTWTEEVKMFFGIQRKHTRDKRYIIICARLNLSYLLSVTPLIEFDYKTAV